MLSSIAIIDFGSQFTRLIANRIREMSVYCEIFSSKVSFEKLLKFDGFIFSGGPQSISDSFYDTNTNIVYEVIKYNEVKNVPILGICYGQQIICHYLGGRVKKNFKQEFGRIKIKIIKESPIIRDLCDLGSEIEVLMNHVDSVIDIPSGFNIIGLSTINKTVALIANENRKIYCTQFHPEVKATVNGKKLLSNFLDIANCKRNWNLNSLIEKQQEKIKNLIGKKNVIAAVSGGIDSSVAAILTYRAIGKQLNCVFIDTGLLRKDQIISNLNEIPIRYINKSKLFFSRLSGIADPEQKRKIIGATFIEILEEEANRIGNVDFLMQGTIYSDVIESGHSLYDSTIKNSSIIKSHHNVGGLPKSMSLKLVEPLFYLFKDEVRLIGKEIGLSDEIIFQHPFPGPGFAIRIIGEVNEEKVRILRDIDEIYISTMKNYDIYKEVWQAFPILLPVKAVGVVGDNRLYDGYVCVLRAVTSYDSGMTSDTFPFENKNRYSLIFWDFLQNVSSIIINNVLKINRVVYDLTSKPPGTIEWE